MGGTDPENWRVDLSNDVAREVRNLLLIPEGRRRKEGKPATDKEIMEFYELEKDDYLKIKVWLRESILGQERLGNILHPGEARQEPLAGNGIVEEKEVKLRSLEMRRRREMMTAKKAAELVGRMEIEAVADGEDDEDDEEVKIIKRYLMKALSKGNATAGQVLLKLKGRLVEKQEVRHGLTADEIARRNLEAEQELRNFRGQGGA